MVATVVLLLGIVSACIANLSAAITDARPELALRDWTQIWRGANAYLRGEDPWAQLPRTDLPYPYRYRNGYPLPALWLAGLVRHWSLPTFAWWWTFLSVFAATVALARRNVWHSLIVLSAPLLASTSLLQWSGILVAAAHWDALMLVAACKPNIGLALLAYRPTLRRTALLAAPLLAAVVIEPSWLERWRDAAGSLGYLPPALLWRTAGPLLLLGALRWRTPEGRLLLALALIPHNLMGYEQLLLFLVARRGRETLLLVVCGWLAAWWISIRLTLPHASPEAMQQEFTLPVMLLLYLPALLLVLTRPNDPEAPDAHRSALLRF